MHHIAGDHAGYIDGIFGRAVLRGVAEFALFEIEHSAMLLNRHRNHVDASLDTFLSHSLRPQHSSVRVSINDLQVDRLGARIVSGMVSGVEIDCRKIRDPGSAKTLFGCSRHRNSQAETGADRGSLGSPELRITSTNRIRRNSPLPARRSSQGQERPFPRYEIAHLDSVPDRPEMRVGGAHGFVHADAAFWAYFEPGGFCKIGLGPHADGKDYKIGRKRHAGLGSDLKPLCSFLELCYRIAKLQPRFVSEKTLANKIHHLRINRWHQLIRRFNDRDLQPPMRQILGHFQPDETTADHNRTLGLFAIDPLADSAAVRYGSQHKNSRQIDSRKWGPNRRGAGRQQKSVVGLSLRKTGLQVADLNLLRLTVDRHHLVMRLNIDIESVAEQFRRSDE